VLASGGRFGGVTFDLTGETKPAGIEGQEWNNDCG